MFEQLGTNFRFIHCFKEGLAREFVDQAQLKMLRYCANVRACVQVLLH